MKVKIEREDGEECYFRAVEFSIAEGDTSGLIEMFWRVCYPFVVGSDKIADQAIQILNENTEYFDGPHWDNLVRGMSENLRNALKETLCKTKDH